MNGVNDSITKVRISNVDFITLNKPENGNVINNDNLLILNEMFKSSDVDPECRVIVLTGKDGIFSRGMDFNSLLKINGKITEDWARPYIETLLTIRNSSKPVIAAVDGEVTAGGMGLMLSTDIIISSDRSQFGLTEVLFGLIPAMVLPLLMERISLKKARSLIISSKKLNAKEALNIGLVDEIEESGNLFDKKVKNTIKRLLFTSPNAITVIKNHTNYITTYDIKKSLEEGLVKFTELINKPENINAIKLFMNGELPNWCLSFKKDK